MDELNREVKEALKKTPDESKEFNALIYSRHGCSYIEFIERNLKEINESRRWHTESPLDKSAIY